MPTVGLCWMPSLLRLRLRLCQVGILIFPICQRRKRFCRSCYSGLTISPQTLIHLGALNRTLSGKVGFAEVISNDEVILGGGRLLSQ